MTTGGEQTAYRWVAGRRQRDFRCAATPSGALAFHRQLPGYAVTPLTPLPRLAEELGLGAVHAKDESARLGLPAFKGLGASWAVRRVIEDFGGAGRLTLTTATDGNHGRAVARFSRLEGHRAAVFVPRGVHPDAVSAIRAEGADVTTIDGDYDDAVSAARQFAASSPDRVLVQDMAWEGYDRIPQWIVDGYDTLFAEVDDQLDGRQPDLVIVPTGVGSLLQAALTHYRHDTRGQRTAVVAVEPASAACVAASLTAGRAIAVATGVTTMAGLNCGTPSSLAWPLIAAGLDGAIAVDDAASATAARDLASEGVAAGPCGAAPLAGLRALRADRDSAGPGDRLDLGPGSLVVLLVTEGAEANPQT